MNNKKIQLTSSLFALTVLLGSCAEKKIAEEKTVDTSHNIFTGNDTVTENKDTTYQNRKTGAVTKKKRTKEVKYDEQGKKISESEETQVR